MMARIEGQLPGTWQELEAVVGRVLAECGYDVEVQKNVKLARGDVDIDVWADDHSGPPNVIAIECKRWKTSVRRTWCTRSPRAACASANEHHFIEAGGDELTAW